MVPYVELKYGLHIKVRMKLPIYLPHFLLSHRTQITNSRFHLLCQTLPDQNLSMDQLNSPFFRLPRELRDEVYAYYVSEEGGYVQEPTTRKLRTFHGKAIDLALNLTCKRIALEIDGFGLRMNAITFRPLLSRPSIIDKHSDAGILEQAFETHAEALEHMLSWCHPLVTMPILFESSRQFQKTRPCKANSLSIPKTSNMI
jgi:hypothetical protein